jgi:predicted RNA-binding Zn ribbon-like protein
MPEHRAGTPSRLKDLESFLWRDFEGGLRDWITWVHQHFPDTSKNSAEAVFQWGMSLHAALRSLQAANSGVSDGQQFDACQVLNNLIADYSIQPRIGEQARLCLASDHLPDPVLFLILLALEALQSGVWRRFKLCQEPTCRASFYDASKAAGKTWCSMEICGSRNKMRRYREKLAFRPPD